ncbi:ATP-binding protein [Spongiimicrobium sp. 3-5]|uniref:tetratricopeptide repeat-containing sensor histidine kinase n=1 Tax=Spongiimicrobium sp. 3-5 TaxID=3332596 RepID=UPI003980D083
MSPFVTYFLALQKLFSRYSILLMLLFCCTQLCIAQENVREKIKRDLYALQAKHDFSPKDTVYIDLLNELSREIRFVNTDSLLLLSKQALKYSRSTGYKAGESSSLLRLGDYYSDQGENTKAIDNYEKSLALASEIKNSGLMLRSQNNLAGEHAYKGNYAEALNGYLEGIDLATKFEEKVMLSIMNENIANLYTSQKDYEQALEFYKKVTKINNDIGDPVNMAESMSNVASLYADMGKLDYAMFNINKSITIFEQHKIMDWLAFAYEIKGKTYLKENKFKWALYWYNQADMLHKELQDDRGKIDLFNGMAEAYLGLQKDSISQEYALEAFRISTKIKFVEGTQKCAKTLYKINKNRKDFDTALDYHELYQRLSDTLSRNENKKSLTMLKTKVRHDQQREELMIQNQKALAKQRNYVYFALSVILVFIVITILVRRGEKIQKKLNRELQSKKEALEKREEELSAINETKTKLFSIIGHDLRGPIGALQGLLKLFKDGEVNKTEFFEFIPKLKGDVDHISFTLNNLLSWGQTQLNGAVTKPSVVALESLVLENINLLSEIADNKSIKLVSKLAENTLTWSDVNQIDIVVRNLISNALKFTPENGMVTIEASEKSKHWEVSVRDTGIGMDKITQEKIFANNSNITTYGTNDEKGTGLGLSLCKEMVEKNNGTIWVESTLRKGSCFYFTLPKSEKTYERTA